MKPQIRLLLAPVAATVVSSLILYGCGSGSPAGIVTTGTPAGATGGVELVAVPVAGANSPFIGVMMKVTCANGITGQDVVGTNAAPGDGIITVIGGCTFPIRVEAIGAGKMRPIGAPTDGSQDLAYDPAVNLPVSNVLASVPKTPAPVNPVTTLVADQITTLSSETSATLDARKAAIAAALGLAGGKTDLDQDYRNAGVAAAATTIVQVAALAAANAASSGMPAGVRSGTSLGQVIALGLATQAKTAASNSLTNATEIAAALKTVDARLDVSTAASLFAIDSDAIRVNNLIATYVPASTDAGGKVNALVANAVTAAQATVTAGTAPAATIAQALQTLADAAARQQQVAQDSVRNAAAKMVADVTSTSDVSATAVSVAQAAAAKIMADDTTFMQQAGAKPSDIAAQAQVVAASVAAAIKADVAAANKIFAAPPAVGISGSAGALVAQVESVVTAITASWTVTVDATKAGADALKVAAAIKDIAAPAATDATTVAAFQAAVGAVASKVDPTKVNIADTTTKINLMTAVNDLQPGLATAVGNTPAGAGAAAALAQQAAQTQLGGVGTKVDFATPLAIGSAPTALPTTTTTSSTSSTARATTTTIPLCDPLSPPPTPGTGAACITFTTTSTASTSNTVSTTTTTTIPGASIVLATATTVNSGGYTGVGVNDPANHGVAYMGAPLSFGPYLISGLGAASNVTMFGTFVGYQTIQINGGVATTAGTISNGDTLTVVVDLAGFLANAMNTVWITLPYNSVLAPKIKVGTMTVTFGNASGGGILTCADPTMPPPPGNLPCRTTEYTTTTTTGTTTTGAGATSTAATTYTYTTIGTITTTTAFAGIPMNVGVTLASPFASMPGIGVNNPTGAVDYTGAPIAFGPYTVTGLSATAGVSLPANAGLETFTKFSVNGGAYGTTGTVNNGNTISVQFDLASYIATFIGGPLSYSSILAARINVGTQTAIFTILTCSDPMVPPPPGNNYCR